MMMMMTTTKIRALISNRDENDEAKDLEENLSATRLVIVTL
jgi:hypothetical protein